MGSEVLIVVEAAREDLGGSRVAVAADEIVEAGDAVVDAGFVLGLDHAVGVEREQVAFDEGQAVLAVGFAAQAEDDDFFGGFDAKPVKPAAMRKTSGGSGGGGTGKLVMPSKGSTSVKIAVKPAVKKLAVSDDVSDGWDDF